MPILEKLCREPNSVAGYRRRQALTSPDILKHLPNYARANHLCGTVGKPATPAKTKCNETQTAQTSTRSGHIRRNALDWTSFSCIMFTTPTSCFPPDTSETKLDHTNAPYFSRHVNQPKQRLCDAEDHPGIKSKRCEEISSLDYSESSSSDESEDVQECIESAIVASIPVVLDFSSMEKEMGDFKCVICLDILNNFDSLATVSGCKHCFCFSVS